MRVLLLSEHYLPKVGGTVSYVEKISLNLAKQGVEVFLLIPSLGELGRVRSEKIRENLTLMHLGVSKHSQLKYSGEERDVLCNWVKDKIVGVACELKVDLVHLLYGLFLANVLPTEKLKVKRIKTGHTIHNIPPLECSTSWSKDQKSYYYADLLRKKIVKGINKQRIQRNKFDFYLTPSELVKEHLSSYLPTANIYAIRHGGAESIPSGIENEQQVKSNVLLTVGGMVPHKSQHEIPTIANHLRKKGIDFTWYVVGPIRNKRYVNALKEQIRRFKLENYVILRNDVDDAGLSKMYQSAKLYVHLSTEEGFCMTVLDAIAYGIPTLARPTGAIPEMLEDAGGNLLDLNPKYVPEVLEHYIRISDSLKIGQDRLNRFKEKYTWSSSVNELIRVYIQ